MQDLKELQQSLPEVVYMRLIEEAKYISGIFNLDETQSAVVERALFMGARIAQKGGRD